MKNKYTFKFLNEIEELKDKIKKYNIKYKKISKKYNRKEKNVNNYIEQRNLMFQYREEIIKLLKEIIQDFPYFNNNAVIYLTGSYARNTVRLFSDLDLNIVYLKGTGKKYMKYEELFYYYVCQIFGMNRCGVHSIITACNDSKNYEYVVQNLNQKPIKINLLDKKNNIQYIIDSEYKKRFYLQYLNNKNYKIIFNNLLDKNKKNGIHEWSNNFIFLNENKKIMDYYNEYQSQLINNLSGKYVMEQANKIINDNLIYENFKIKSNIDIKKNYQMEEFHFLYEVVILLQLLKIKETNIIYSDYNDLYNNSNNNMKDLLNNLYEYNFYLYKLNLYFEKYNIPYSIHNYYEIDLSKYTDLNIFLNELFHFKTKINKKFMNALKGEIKNDT